MSDPDRSMIFPSSHGNGELIRAQRSSALSSISAIETSGAGEVGAFIITETGRPD